MIGPPSDGLTCAHLGPEAVVWHPGLPLPILYGPLQLRAADELERTDGEIGAAAAAMTTGGVPAERAMAIVTLVAGQLGSVVATPQPADRYRPPATLVTPLTQAVFLGAVHTVSVRVGDLNMSVLCDTRDGADALAAVLPQGPDPNLPLGESVRFVLTERLALERFGSPQPALWNERAQPLAVGDRPLVLAALNRQLGRMTLARSDQFRGIGLRLVPIVRMGRVTLVEPEALPFLADRNGVPAAFDELALVDGEAGSLTDPNGGSPLPISDIVVETGSRLRVSPGWLAWRVALYGFLGNDLRNDGHQVVEAAVAATRRGTVTSVAHISDSNALRW